MERNDCYKDDREESKYSVLWYGYIPADDTWNPAYHIHQHFNRRYWERQRRVEQQSPQVSS